MSQILFLLVGIILGALLCWQIMLALHHKRTRFLAAQAQQEKLELQSEVAAQKNRVFLTFFEAFDGGSATLNDEARIVVSNRALEKRLGYPQSALSGRSLLNLLHPQDAAPVQAFFSFDCRFGGGRDLPAIRARTPFLFQRRQNFVGESWGVGSIGTVSVRKGLFSGLCEQS